MDKFLELRNAIINKNKKITFGKYKGWIIADVINFDPKYVQWALKNVSFFYLQDKEIEFLNYCLEEKRHNEERERHERLMQDYEDDSKLCNRRSNVDWNSLGPCEKDFYDTFYPDSF